MRKIILASAGDSITAKLVEEAGFDAVWVSGFEASARLGLPDNGSITMDEMLNICKPIVKSINIPVWVDVDTGYNVFKRTVREFESIGVTGICVEDVDPKHKQNSLWGGKVPLMDMEEFAEMIMSTNKRQLSVMARTEALIRGYGEIEAMKRLMYYSDHAGADWLLPHTRSKDLILTVPKNYCYAIVPTKFPEYTNQQLFDMGYSMVIYANQTERVKIKAVREALKLMKEQGCALQVEQTLSATLDDMKGLTPC